MREKYSYVSYATLHFIFRIVEFNRNYIKCTKLGHDLSAQGVRIRNLLICYTIQREIHETHKIWHPSEQNYFFAHFNEREQYFQGVYEKFGNPGGEGGKFWGPILENAEGKGGHTANPFCGGGIDVFWNHTFLQIHMFRLIDRSLCLTYRTHAMNYFASLGIFMCQGCRR